MTAAPWGEPEWRAVYAALEAGWHGELTERDRAGYHVFLSKVPPAQALAGLRALAERGPAHRPSAAKILKAARDVDSPPVPSWQEVLTALPAIFRAGATFRDIPTGTYLLAGREAILMAGEDVHPYVRAFIASYGVDRLANEQFYHERYAHVVQERVRRDWEDFVERAEERIAAGSALGITDPRDRRRALERLDPLRTLRADRRSIGQITQDEVNSIDRAELEAGPETGGAGT